jgi:hypothetical protein
MINSSLLFYTYLCFSDPLILIIRLNYLKDNSVIFFENSYQQKGLRPQCWIKINFWRKGFNIFIRSVRPLKSYMICVQNGVSQVGFYL